MFSPDSSNNEVLLRKYLPYNNIGGEEDDDDMDMDPYSSDHFRMFEFKVRRCTRSRSHDWTDCPFAHPGEKARRRDPKRFHYSGTVCNEYRQAGGCSRGDNCEFAHGVFECWLHPARYRTEACKDGKNCKRKVCFFAHTPQQLRILPPNASAAELSSSSSPVSSSSDKRFRNMLPFSSSNSSHCCVYCHSVTSSPTSTLMGISHFSPPVSPSKSISPPLSPVCSRRLSSKFSTFGRYGDRWIASESCGLKKFDIGMLSYKDVLTELMNSMETMNVNEGNSHAAVLGSSSINGNQSWVDACQDQQHQQQQQQFILSPSTPNYTSVPTTNIDFFNGSSSKNYKSSSSSSAIDDKFNDNGFSCPDLGWVNELLM